MFGQKRYADINRLLNQRFEDKKVLIAAHRGSWHGNVIQNTTLAYKAALQMGADFVETDTTITRDGVVYSLHDGVEPVLFGPPWNALHMTSRQLEKYDCLNALGVPCLQRVERLETVCAALNHDELINIDRSWRAGGKVLEILDRFPHMLHQALLKAPLRERWILDQLNAHPNKYMFMPICSTLKEVEEACAYPELNVVGVELIAKTPEDELFSDRAIAAIHDQGLFCWVNALVITDYDPMEALYGGLDDDRSIDQGAEYGWGRLMDKGIDVIQTDWPSLVRDYRAIRYQ